MMFIIDLAFGTFRRRNGDFRLYMRNQCTNTRGSATETRVVREPEQSCQSIVDDILRGYQNQAAAGNFDRQHSNHTETPPNSSGDLQGIPSASTTKGQKRRRLNGPDGSRNGSGTSGTVEETATTRHNEPSEPELEKAIRLLVTKIRKGLQPKKSDSKSHPSQELNDTQVPQVEKILDNIQAPNMGNGQLGGPSNSLAVSVAMEKILWLQSYVIESSAQEHAWKSRLLASCMYLLRVAITTSGSSWEGSSIDGAWEDPPIDGVSAHTLRRWRDATWMINTIVGKLSSTWGWKAYCVYESLASMTKGDCTASA